MWWIKSTDVVILWNPNEALQKYMKQWNWGDDQVSAKVSKGICQKAEEILENKKTKKKSEKAEKKKKKKKHAS